MSVAMLRGLSSHLFKVDIFFCLGRYIMISDTLD